MHLYTGTLSELKLSLLSYGIQPYSFPVYEGGIVDRVRNTRELWSSTTRNTRTDGQGHVLNTVSYQNETVDSGSSDEQKIYPNEADCLLGRGKPYQSFAGNRRLAEIIEPLRLRYIAAASRNEKKEIVDKAIELHFQEGGRFLRRSSMGSGWEKADENEVRNKVSQIFRARLKRPRSSSSSEESSANN